MIISYFALLNCEFEKNLWFQEYQMQNQMFHNFSIEFQRLFKTIF